MYQQSSWKGGLFLPRRKLKIVVNVNASMNQDLIDWWLTLLESSKTVTIQLWITVNVMIKMIKVIVPIYLMVTVKGEYFACTKLHVLWLRVSLFAKVKDKLMCFPIIAVNEWLLKPDCYIQCQCHAVGWHMTQVINFLSCEFCFLWFGKAEDFNQLILVFSPFTGIVNWHKFWISGKFILSIQFYLLI